MWVARVCMVITCYLTKEWPYKKIMHSNEYINDSHVLYVLYSLLIWYWTNTHLQAIKWHISVMRKVNDIGRGNKHSHKVISKSVVTTAGNMQWFIPCILIYIRWIADLIIALITCQVPITYGTGTISLLCYQMVWHFPVSSLHRHKIDRKVRDVFLQVIRLSMDSFKLMLRIGVLHTLQWRHNGLDGLSNHQPRHCLLSCLLRRRSKKTSKLRVTGLCAGNSPVTGEFPAQMASKAENVPIWWRHHEEQNKNYYSISAAFTTRQPTH